MSALYAGMTISGHPLRPVTAAKVAEWQTYDLGPLTCECGRLTARLDDSGRLQVINSAGRLVHVPYTDNR